MMHCHFIEDKKVGKVFIPGCWGGAVYGSIEFCTCDRGPRTFEAFEQARYNEVLNKLTSELNELQKENNQLKRIIRKLTGKQFTTN